MLTAMNDTADLKKSTTLSLTIDPMYVRSWGVWESIREFIQNALDAHDKCHQMTIERGGGAAQTIYIRNVGTTLSRRSLLLGGTSKADDASQRGKFGEGYKLAFLVLCRNGIEVQVRTGSEIWTPFIERDDAFGSELLKVRVRPAAKHEEMIEVRIKGVSDEVFDLICDKMLIDIPGLERTNLSAAEVIHVGEAKILTGEKHKSKLYVRGLFAGNLPDAYEYGYDLPGVELDRDRRLADPWSLRSKLKSTLEAAVHSEKIGADHLLNILGTNCGEAQTLRSMYEYGTKDLLTKAVAKAFHAKHGDDAVPADSMAESEELSHFGLKAAAVSSAIKKIVEAEEGSVESKKSSRKTDAKTLYTFAELTALEQTNIKWGLKMASIGSPLFDAKKVQIVDFYGEQTLGLHDPKTGTISVARKLLGDRAEVVRTLVHEQAHAEGGTMNADSMELIFGRIIVAIDEMVGGL